MCEVKQKMMPGLLTGCGSPAQDSTCRMVCGSDRPFSVGQHLVQSPFDSRHRLADCLYLLLLVRHIVRVRNDLKRIAEMMIHQFYGAQLLDHGAPATLFIKQDQQPEENGDPQIVKEDARASDLVGAARYSQGPLPGRKLKNRREM